MSTKFNVETCRDILDKVDGSQAGIQNASARLVFWKRNASDVVRCWENAFQKADMEKRLILIYLANDVVQTSRRAGREFIEAFHMALPEAFKHMMKHSDERVQQRLKKLVHVWRDRNVWGNRALALYSEMVRGVSSPGSAEARQPLERSNVVPESLSKVISLLKIAQEAQASAQEAAQGDDTAHALAATEVRSFHEPHTPHHGKPVHDAVGPM
jgi:regulator of Ty1 transposition protein 103